MRVDVLHRRADGRLRLIEVKSSASLKEEHLDDVAIQYRVLSRCGLDVGSCCLAHVNRSFVFRGGSVDPWRFFRIRNVTRQVARLQPKLTFQLRAAFTVLSMPKAPDIAPGKHCTSPVTCEFFDCCNPPLPDDHIGYLPRLHASAEEELEEMGVESIRDVPDDFELTEIQRRACTSVQTGEPWFSPGLGEVLGRLKYPLYFMDFETVNRAVPLFAGHASLRPLAVPVVGACRSGNRARTGALRVSRHRRERSPARVHLVTLCCAGRQREHRRVFLVRVSAPFRPCQMVSRIRGSDQRDPSPPVRSAASRARAHLPSGVRRLVLHQVCLARARAEYDLRWHGGRERAGCRGGLGVARAWRVGSATSETGSGRLCCDYCGQDTLAMVSLLEMLRSISSCLDKV